MSKEQVKLIFVGDPMCSWCYGFGKEMESIVESIPEIDVQIVVGGMAAGATTVLDDAGKMFRLKHWARVEEVSGAEFNRDALMARRNFVYDTEPVCRAVVAARLIAPEADLLKVFRVFQRAFYVEGLDTTSGNVLSTIGVRALAEQGFEGSAEAFYEVWASEDAIRAAQADFSRTQRMGVTGFPTLFVEYGGKFGKLCSGFAKADSITAALRSLAA